MRKLQAFIYLQLEEAKKKKKKKFSHSPDATVCPDQRSASFNLKKAVF